MMSERNPAPPHANGGRFETRLLQEQLETVMKRNVTPALGQLVGQAVATLNDAQAELRRQSQRWAQAARQQPLTSMGLAALAGFVLARLMGR